MNDGLKQRVVGAIVLAALAVIFLPMLFDFSGERHVDKTSRIPQRPMVEPVTFAEPERPAGVETPKPADQVYQLEKSRAEEDRAATEQQVAGESTPEPGLTENGMLAGWVIQVGSFKEQERADKLEQSLLDDGYKAYQLEDRNSGFYRVYVGPDADKKHALQVQKRIDGKYKVKSRILEFEP